jgi:hypothetical protein
MIHFDPTNRRLSLKIDKSDVVNYFCEKAEHWISDGQYESTLPPHPYDFLDNLFLRELPKNIPTSTSKIESLSLSFRSRKVAHHMNTVRLLFGARLILDLDRHMETLFRYTHNYVVSTKEIGQIEIIAEGDFFSETIAAWNQPVLIYKYKKLKTKENHSFDFFNNNIFTDDSISIQRLHAIINDCPCEPRHFVPYYSNGTTFLFYACPLCSKKYICSCFKPVETFWENAMLNSIRVNEFNNDNMPIDITYKDQICDVCRGVIPSREFMSPQNVSIFMTKYAPWVYREAVIHEGVTLPYITNTPEMRRAENRMRDKFGFYKIGERWINETLLYKTLKFYFEDDVEIQFHARPDFLSGQEYDIYFPELRLLGF